MDKLQNIIAEGKTQRLVSIDALRGFDMFWIIGGARLFGIIFTLRQVPWMARVALEFEHSIWHGFTFYDLVFPLFLFIVGLAIPFSLSKYSRDADIFKNSAAYGYIRIIIRTITLLVLGFIVNGLLDFNFSSMRWPGVLQRIAICYLFAAVILMLTKGRRQALIIGIIIIIIVAGYWAIMRFVPVPGGVAGDLSQEGNLAGYIDRAIIPGSFCCYGYGDNEGLLTTLPSIASTLIGVMAGLLLKTGKSHNYKLKWLSIAGAGSFAAGFLWNIVFPVNKILWTSSYVLFSGGLSLLLFVFFYWLIDVKGYKKWAFFFTVIGMNAITIYVIQAIFDFGIITDIFLHGFVGRLGIAKDIFYMVCFIAVKWLFLYFLYKKKIFLKA
jgi:predicted acyltransferase